MHQVLSYEAAVRANNSAEYRQYISKRTCFSLVVTIAFFTLISGYLLGNFVAERKHHLRMLLQRRLNEPNVLKTIDALSSSSASGAESKPSSDLLSSSGQTGESLYSLDLSVDDYAKIREMHVYQKAKEKLLASAQILNRMLQQDENYRSTSLNTEIFNRYISCTQDVPPNTSIDSNQFIEQLIDNTVARQRDCLRIIQAIINTNLANG